MTLSDSITSIKSANPKWGDIGDALDIMSETRIVLIARLLAADQTIANNTNTIVLFDHVVKEDTDYITYNPATGVATIVKAGAYLLNGGCYWAENNTGIRIFSFRASVLGEYFGTVRNMGVTSSQTAMSLTSCRKCGWSAGNTFSAVVYQLSTGNLNLTHLSGALNWMSVIRLFD